LIILALTPEIVDAFQHLTSLITVHASGVVIKAAAFEFFYEIIGVKLRQIHFGLGGDCDIFTHGLSYSAGGSKRATTAMYKIITKTTTPVNDITPNPLARLDPARGVQLPWAWVLPIAGLAVACMPSG
jgi:hypothetical protein